MERFVFSPNDNNDLSVPLIYHKPKSDSAMENVENVNVQTSWSPVHIGKYHDSSYTASNADM